PRRAALADGPAAPLRIRRHPALRQPSPRARGAGLHRARPAAGLAGLGPPGGLARGPEPAPRQPPRIRPPDASPRGGPARRLREGDMAVLRRLLLVFLLALPVLLGAQTASEYDIKAAFLYNFTKFVDWPPDAFPDPSSLKVCVLGENTFGASLQTISGEL